MKIPTLGLGKIAGIPISLIAALVAAWYFFIRSSWESTKESDPKSFAAGWKWGSNSSSKPTSPPKEELKPGYRWKIAEGEPGAKYKWYAGQQFTLRAIQ